jgi:hypothetical protein
MAGGELEYRILIHAPVGKDARLIADLFGRAGIDCSVCGQLDQLVEELGRGAGALLVGDEAITPDFLRALQHFIEHQQGWSDLPVLIMSRRGAASPACSTATWSWATSRCWSARRKA